MRDLSPQQAMFVREYTLGASAAEAARRAGYSEHYAARASEKVLGIPKVRAAVEAERDRIRQVSDLTADRFMEKLENSLRLAIDAKQFTAAARLLELQGKLGGLLIERSHLMVEAVNIVDALAEARARALQPRDMGPVVLASALDSGGPTVDNPFAE